MLKRKIYNKLLEWERQREKEKLQKCLLIKGARQVVNDFIYITIWT